MACKTPEYVTTGSHEPAYHQLIYSDNFNILKGSLGLTMNENNPLPHTLKPAQIWQLICRQYHQWRLLAVTKLITKWTIFWVDFYYSGGKMLDSLETDETAKIGSIITFPNSSSTPRKWARLSIFGIKIQVFSLSIHFENQNNFKRHTLRCLSPTSEPIHPCSHYWQSFVWFLVYILYENRSKHT